MAPEALAEVNGLLEGLNAEHASAAQVEMLKNVIWTYRTATGQPQQIDAAKAKEILHGCVAAFGRRFNAETFMAGLNCASGPLSFEIKGPQDAPQTLNLTMIGAPVMVRNVTGGAS